MNTKLSNLPHWARVAFLTRRARDVLVVFDANWPNVVPARRSAVTSAIEIAEASAASGVAHEDVAAAWLEALQTAGRALMAPGGPYPLDPEDGPSPADSHSAALASLAAKVAEFAARTAASNLTDSPDVADRGYGFAISVAVEAQQLGLIEDWENELKVMRRLARNQRWTDHSAVDPQAWESASESRTWRWWKLW